MIASIALIVVGLILILMLVEIGLSPIGFDPMAFVLYAVIAVVVEIVGWYTYFTGHWPLWSKLCQVN